MSTWHGANREMFAAASRKSLVAGFASKLALPPAEQPAQQVAFASLHVGQHSELETSASPWKGPQLDDPWHGWRGPGHPPDRKIRDFAEIISAFLATPSPLIR